MSMSTTVIGFIPPDEQWERMKAIWNACQQAKIEIPDEVRKFFNYSDPAGLPGMSVSLKECIREWRGGEEGQGYELEVDKLPRSVKILRFYNSW